MKEYFCPNCNIKFPVKEGEEPRCPKCLKKQGLIEIKPTKTSSKKGIAIVVAMFSIILIGGLIVYMVQTGGRRTSGQFSDSAISEKKNISKKIDTSSVKDFYLNYQGKKGIIKLLKIINTNCKFDKHAPFEAATTFKKVVKEKKVCSEYSAINLIFLVANAQKLSLDYFIYKEKRDGHTQPDGVHFAVGFGSEKYPISKSFKGDKLKKFERVDEDTVYSLILNKIAYDYIERKEFKKASEILNKAFSLFTSTKSPYLLFTKCLLSARQKMFEFAIPDCELALNIDQDAKGYAVYAAINFENKSFHKALKLYEEALKQDSSYLDAYKGIIETEILQYPIVEKSRKSKVVDEINNAIKKIESIDKNYKYLSLLKAKAKMLTGDFSGSEDLLQKSVSNHPDIKEAFYLLGNYYINSKLWDEAEKVLNKLLKANPDDIKGLKMLLTVYRGAEKPDQALVIAKKILKLNPEEPGINLIIAEILFKKKDYKNGLVYIDKEIEKNPDNPAVLQLKAEILFSLKKYDDSLKVLNDIIKKWNKYFNAYLVKSVILLNQKKVKKFNDNVKKLSKNIVKGDFILGQKLIELGYEDEGIRLIENYYENHGDDEEAAIVLALIYKQLGKEKKFEEIKNKALKRSKNKDLFKERLKEALSSIKDNGNK